MLPDRPTMAELITRQGHLRGAHPLLVCDAERLDYAGAERRSAVIARGLIALGAGKGTHVGLLYPNGEEFVVAMLAAARIGAVVVPFTTFATARELGEHLSDADVAILLATRAYRSHDYVRRCRETLGLESFDQESFDGTQPLFTPAAPQLRHVAFDLEHVARLAAAVDPALLSAMEDDVDGSDPLAIVYTSGST
ncbi:MAG: AMP-binding protein, partial [Myxococcota bacterium]